jgi:glutathione synthase/RimK-type ligase-like ATP-grasp enzyme
MRGKIYAGHPIPKLEQMARMAAAGLPVPAFAEITPDVELSEQTFGSHVVVKPGYSLSSQGDDITLMRRDKVRYRPREQFPPEHPGRYGPMYAQQFIDTGPMVNHYRVLTLFGKPLLAYRNTSLIERPPLDASDDVLAKVAVKARRRASTAKTELIQEPDVLALASRTYAALREIPLHGVDVIREHGSGKLFVLEVNPGGNTWIFSKGNTTTRLQQALGTDRLADQFDAFTTAAKVLIERTRAEAE